MKGEGSEVEGCVGNEESLESMRNPGAKTQSGGTSQSARGFIIPCGLPKFG